MHILTVRSALTDSGPGTQPLVIAKHMLSIGHTTCFATSGGAYVDTIRTSGFDVRIIPELAPNKHQPLSILLAIAKLAKMMAKEKPDIIHGHNAAATVCAAIAAKSVGLRIPCVTSVRGVEERSTHQWRNKIWKYVPGVLLGVCEKTRERLLTFGVPNERIRVTFNGVDTNRFRPSAINAAVHKAALGLDGKIVVGVTGAMLLEPFIDGPTKGQHKLVEALAMIKDKYPDLRILFVGDGPARLYIENIAKEKGVTDRVVFAGRRFDVPEMLSAMDIYCQPSIFGEFFPNAIIEAMAMGKPWIGSDIAGLSELTSNNMAGWVSPIGDVQSLADNLEKLASDPELRMIRGNAGLEFVKDNLTIDSVVNRILEAYAFSMRKLKES
jgi:glycosyltransferase involved in cell wall biosynthesis